ncbi:MAG: dihydroorotate dehydrogenase electron transfer subunit [Planctomycetia bacterium]|nr:dihydroorotate dehydrogenase electron transfer subunit [Planctomycetia bacterium]
MNIYHGTTRIVENRRVAQDLWSVRFEAPAEEIYTPKPGQFVMLRVPGCRAPLLGRPLAIYRVVEPTWQVVYAVVGEGTRLLARQLPGMAIEFWGPLGNGFPIDETCQNPVLVAGGIGQTPLYLLAQAFLNRPGVEKVTLLLGCRDKAHLACVEDFQALSPDRLELRIATDDGSMGHPGFVTDLLSDAIREAPHLYTCGPLPMLKKVAAFAVSRGIPCHVSLETPMACGMGICFTCVTKCKADTPQGWDYCRTCTEGPVFDAEKILF